jgi:hypothetical protein
VMPSGAPTRPSPPPFMPRSKRPTSPTTSSTAAPSASAKGRIEHRRRDAAEPERQARGGEPGGRQRGERCFPWCRSTSADV